MYVTPSSCWPRRSAWSVADLEALADRLDQLAEELADAALDALRDAIDAGEAKPELERRLTRARRAVQRAASLVRDRAEGPDDL